MKVRYLYPIPFIWLIATILYSRTMYDPTGWIQGFGYVMGAIAITILLLIGIIIYHVMTRRDKGPGPKLLSIGIAIAAIAIFSFVMYTIDQTPRHYEFCDESVGEWDLDSQCTTDYYDALSSHNRTLLLGRIVVGLITFTIVFVSLRRKHPPENQIPN